MPNERYSSQFVINFQGFRVDCGFLIQEFAAFNLQDKSIIHYFFSHPLELDHFDYYTYSCSKKFHCIDKSFGSSNYSLLSQFFALNSSAIFFVQGIETCSILTEFCSNTIVNIENVLHSSSSNIVNTFHFKCSLPDHNVLVDFPNCSFKNAINLGFRFVDWFSL